MTYRTSGQRPHRSSGPRNFRRSTRTPKSFFDISKFINKAELKQEVVSFVPENTFANLDLNPLLKRNILAKGYDLPTPIQDKGIIPVLNGKDIVGIANTGTGKTGAFLIPLIDKVLKNPNEKILIVAPVRELAMQIDAELREFARGSGLFSVVIIGGGNMGAQIRELRHPYNFVIGTPGRIKDHIESGYLNLATFKTIVLDEADRMLEMGFINDMRLFMSQMAENRHTLFFSATLSSEIEKLIHDFLHDPVMISVKTQDTSKNIDQDVIRIQGKNKLDVLTDLLLQKEFAKTLVFIRTKHAADRLADALKLSGIKADAIHGNKNQHIRTRVLDNFKKQSGSVLVATDVAARGLDISDISHVINYDLPATYEDYIHRIGRTGRAGKTGKALTFID